MKIQLRPVSSIKPYPNNPRLNDDAVDAVVASIREFGFRQPIADHITSEYRVKTEGRGRTVDEWKLRPERGDNHWFDGLVGCPSRRRSRARPFRGPTGRNALNVSESVLPIFNGDNGHERG